MKKNKSRNYKKVHTKQKAFADRNYTPLDSLNHGKGQLDSPFKKFPKVSFSSWINDFLPNSLWACILSSMLERDEYLELFRQTLRCTHAIEEMQRPRVLSHNFLGSTTNAVFDQVFSAILVNKNARNSLRALRLLSCLPDAHHWHRVLDSPDDPADWNILFHTVADNFNHQNERATDVRWMKLMHEIISGKVRFDPKFAERLEDFRLYPNRGDLTAVRPSIRAMEIMIRPVEAGNEESKDRHFSPLMGESFWKEVKSKTGCILSSEFKHPTVPSRTMCDELMSVMQQLQHHFDSTIQTTSADPRHDGAFGIVLFAMTYLLNITAFHGHDLPFGRMVLRTLVENFITLEYLGVKDDPTLWEQFRRYGAGQAKLAFLKNIREEEVPEFFDLHLMEELANEDMWMEFEDIRIGNWAKTDLRTMAQTCGVKDTYDRYYDWASGFAHGHWIAIREAAFVNCLNPLHRYHRIPGPPMALLPSILPDGTKLINRMLDRINSLYPTFKPRLLLQEVPAAEHTHSKKEKDVAG